MKVNSLNLAVVYLKKSAPSFRIVKYLLSKSKSLVSSNISSTVPSPTGFKLNFNNPPSGRLNTIEAGSVNACSATVEFSAKLRRLSVQLPDKIVDRWFY